MRKDSLIVFATSIVLTLGVVGGAHYLYLQGLNKKPDKEVSPPQFGIANKQAGNRVVKPTARRTAARRTATPIQCTLPDGSVFWTNASRCEDADLDNRLSFADPVKPVPRVRINDSNKNKAKASWSEAANTNKKGLKSIPWKMNNVCSFAIGRAQQIEKKSLRLKDDPAESLWKKSYCRWVCEARSENCKDIEDYLGMTRLCPNRRYSDKSYCNN